MARVLFQNKNQKSGHEKQKIPTTFGVFCFSFRLFWQEKFFWKTDLTGWKGLAILVV